MRPVLPIIIVERATQGLKKRDRTDLGIGDRKLIDVDALSSVNCNVYSLLYLRLYCNLFVLKEKSKSIILMQLLP